MKKITVASKVKPFAAQQAVRRLLAAKKVRREGATKTLRYLAN